MNKQHSFLKGTIILIAANTISKILGAVFKIPLAYILQEEGMAVFNTAMGVYSTVLSFVISGLPLAMSRYIAGQYAMQNYINIKRTVKVTTLLLCVLGLIASFVLYGFSDFFAYAMKEPKAGVAIRMISPAVFFVAWGTVYKSFYEGCINMIPTAISQVIESFIRLGIGIAGAYYLRNAAMEVTATGAISGITIGEIIATLLLFFMYIPSNRKLPYIGETVRKRVICNSLISIALPMLVCSCVSSMLGLADVAMIRNGLLNIRFTAESFLLKYSAYTSLFDNLSNDLKLSLDGARWIYGAYSGYALTVFHLPTGIIGALGVSILPVVTGALARGDNRLVQKTTEIALKLTLIISLPCAVGMFLFSDGILGLLFNNTASAIMLSQLAPCLVLVCVSQLFAVILHASGRIAEPFFNSLVGIAIKLLADFFLIPVGVLNISGAIAGSFFGFMTVMLLNARSVKKHFKINFKIIECVVKPIVACAVMGVVMKLLYNPLCIIFGNDALSLVSSAFVGAVAYLLCLVSLNVVNKNEVRAIRP